MTVQYWMWEWKIFFFFTSDHSYFNLDITLPVRVKPLRRTYLDYSDVDYELLNAHLAIIHRANHLSGYDSDFNRLYTVYRIIIDNLLDQYVPNKVFFLGVTNRGSTQP